MAPPALARMAAGAAAGTRTARLVELGAALADARQRLGADPTHSVMPVLGRVAAALDGEALPDGDAAAVLVVLDELTGMIDQIERTRASLEAELDALARHRTARRSYGGRGSAR